MSRIYIGKRKKGDYEKDWGEIPELHINTIIWIKENCPENGLFRAYWKEEATLEPSLEDTGFGLRYEWYYKDGKRADGISKSWFQTGQLKHTWTWKDGKKNGLYTFWGKNGKKLETYYYNAGIKNGLYTQWYDNGNKMQEFTYVNRKRIDKIREWNRDGSLKKEE